MRKLLNWNPDGKKKELWEQDKNKLQIWFIEAKVWYRKFQRETRGLGLIIIIMIVIMAFSPLFTALINSWLGQALKSDAEKAIERKSYCFKYGCVDSA